MRRIFVSILMLCTTTALSACGGGGSDNPAPKPPTKAVVQIMTSGSLPGGTLIGGIDIALNLPAGVSVKATADAENPGVLVTDSGVLTVSGVAAGANATALGTYTASPNRVAIHVVNPAGFGTGEFVTVDCDIAAGTTVTAGDFTTGTLSVVDLDGAAIAGLAGGMTVEIK